MNKHLLLPVIIVFVGFYSCSGPEAPKAEVIAADTFHPQHTEEELVNDEPIDVFGPRHYEGTLDNARKRVADIIDGMGNRQLSADSYKYDNGSGEGEAQCTQYYFYGPQKYEDRKIWCLQMRGQFYNMDYFFDEDDKLFALRQSPAGKDKELSLEIYYNRDGSIMRGSWLKRMSEDTTHLADYKGDYWYDFLEGYPHYTTTQRMKEDKSLKYQQ